MSSPRRYANIGHTHVAADITDLDLSLYAALADNETITGAWTFEGTGERFRLKDPDSTGADAQINIAFDDQTDTRLGYLGFGSTGNNNLYVYADTGNIQLRAPTGNKVIMDNTAILAMKDSGGTEREALQMLSSNVLQVGDTTNTTNIQGSTITFSSPSGLVQVNSGRPIRFADPTGADYAQFNHDGTDFKLTAANTTALEINDISALRMRDGGTLVMYESGASVRNSQFKTMTTTGDPANKTAITRSEGGAITIQSATIADDATATFVVDSYGIHWLMNTYNSTAFAHFGKTSTQAPVDYGSGSNVSMGSTNPDVDTDVNIWPSASTEISVKNRLGSSRTFYLMSFTRDEET